MGEVYVVRRDYGNHDDVARVADRFPTGKILVTESADPSMDSLIARTCAVITEVGGILSHAAISARERGVPCVVGVFDVTLKLRDEDSVLINLTTSEITIVN